MQILATDLTLLWLHCTQLLDPSTSTSTPHSTLTPRPFHAAPSNSSSSFLKLPLPPRLFSFIIESIYDWNWPPSSFLLWLLILIPNPWLLLTSSFIWCLLLWHRNTAWKISFSIHLLHALPPSGLPKLDPNCFFLHLVFLETLYPTRLILWVTYSLKFGTLAESGYLSPDYFVIVKWWNFERRRKEKNSSLLRQ